MFTWLAAALRLPALRRRPDMDDRAAVLTLVARGADELASGLLVVLMPTLRVRFGLTVQQVGWCFQALSTVGALVEPVSGVAIDLVRRRPLLLWGAAGWGAALLLAAGAGGFGWLLAAFALAGAASGPLAHTADVVLVEAHPDTFERVASRSTWLDTIGALSAPVAVTLASWWGFDERLLLVAAGLGLLGYAATFVGTDVPAPAPRPAGTAPADVLHKLRTLMGDPRARRALGALVLFELLDPLELFEPVWLSSVVGASQAVVGLHLAIGLTASLVALFYLDRWLAHHDPGPVLIASSVATLFLYPAWLLVPGVPAKLLLVIPREVAMAPLWPILRSRALAAVPGTGGTTAALTGAVVGLVPVNAAVGWLATRVGLTTTLLGLVVVGFGGLLAVVRPAPTTAPAAP